MFKYSSADFQFSRGFR